MRTRTTLALFAAAPLLLAATQPERATPGRSVKPMSVTPARPAAQPGAQPETDESQAFIAQEKRVWETIKAQNWQAFDAMLADDFVLVTGQGLENKGQTLNHIKEGRLTSYTLGTWRVIRLGEDAGLVLYKAEQEWTMNDAAHTDTTYCSTVWRKQSGHWLAASHQETSESKPQTPAKPADARDQNAPPKK
jgi:hypothetical protein